MTIEAIERLRAQFLIFKLRERGIPPQIIVAPLGKKFTRVFLRNPHIVETSSSIFLSGGEGGAISTSLAVGILKATSEWIERSAFLQWSQTQSSPTETTGFACFPLALASRSKAIREARKRSFAECIERWAWYHWWNDSTTRYDYVRIALEDHQKTSKILLGHEASEFVDCLRREANLRLFFNATMHIICPHTQLYEERSNPQTVIILLEFSPGQFVAGSASSIQDNKETFMRALSEVLQHFLVAHNALEKGLQGKSIYEKRLLAYAGGNKSEEIGSRLSKAGHRIITIPEAIIDTEVDHKYSDIAYVHRISLRDQVNYLGSDESIFMY